MGREAAYTGKKITWNELLKSEEVYEPKIDFDQFARHDQFLADGDQRCLPGFDLAEQRQAQLLETSVKVVKHAADDQRHPQAGAGRRHQAPEDHPMTQAEQLYASVRASLLGIEEAGSIQRRQQSGQQSRPAGCCPVRNRQIQTRNEGDAGN